MLAPLIHRRIQHDESPAGSEHATSFPESPQVIGRVMQRRVIDHRVELLAPERKLIELGLHPGKLAWKLREKMSRRTQSVAIVIQKVHSHRTMPTQREPVTHPSSAR